MAERENYRIELTGDWSLPDLYAFPHALNQCYAFVYCLDSSRTGTAQASVNNALANFPWAGGYSYVHAWNLFEKQIPAEDKPMLAGIEKHSPGWMEVALNGDVMSHLANGISVMSAAMVGAVVAYKKANSILLGLAAERRKADVENLKASAAQLKQIKACCEELAKSMGFISLADLHAYTNDPEISMKLLMAHHRRLKTLVDYEKNGKVDFNLPGLPGTTTGPEKTTSAKKAAPRRPPAKKSTSRRKKPLIRF